MDVDLKEKLAVTSDEHLIQIVYLKTHGMIDLSLFNSIFIVDKNEGRNKLFAFSKQSGLQPSND